MEQQSVSIAKSGVVCTLPSRTAVLAAANPVGGHYNRAKTVSENLRLNPALLSRFDLVFILLDRPDSEIDGLLSDHIVRLHASRSGRGFFPAATPSRTGDHRAFSVCSSPASLLSVADTLLDRLRRRPNETIEPVPPDLLRKYIAYARAWTSPSLDDGARQVLQDFYLELRRQYHGPGPSGDCVPITLRQLESLIRLTEARARLEIRQVATAEDARDVVDIMRASMADTLSTSNSSLDFSRSLHGSGTSTRGAAKKFVAALQRHAEATRKSTFSVQEMKHVLSACGARVASFVDFLDSLNTQGFLLKKSSNMYQLLIADY